MLPYDLKVMELSGMIQSHVIWKDLRIIVLLMLLILVSSLLERVSLVILHGLAVAVQALGFQMRENLSSTIMNLEKILGY